MKDLKNYSSENVRNALDNGDAQAFDHNWSNRNESLYTHWTPTVPSNQIQLAFRSHWETFSRILKSDKYNQGNRCLEVGCGRGSLSAYFSAAGYDCTLLDISPTVLDIGKRIFDANCLKGRFVTGDATALPFEDGSFDVVFSIGLLEHFEDVERVVSEQIRILAPGGAFIAYVVPEYHDNVQKDFNWINEILKGYAEKTGTSPKEPVFRNNYSSEVYLPIMKKNKLKQIESSGIYPLPMISHSIDFPFSLMPPVSEVALVRHFMEQLDARKEAGGDPWLCDEGYGQALLIWGFKPGEEQIG